MRAPILVSGFLVLLLAGSPSSAQDAATFFQDICAPCHTIGGEPSAGPDLKDVTTRRDRQWLIRFIHDPQEAAEHFPDAAALIKQYGDMMPPTEGASQDMLEALLGYIDQQSGASGVPVHTPTLRTAPAPEAAPTPADIALGREIYEGGRILVNGGPACVSCHSIGTFGGLGGGVLGPDLTASFARLGGASGLSAWLGNPPLPVMRAVYRNAAFDPAERQALVAFLGNAATTAPTSAAATVPPTRFVAMGIAGFLLALAVMGALWSRRFRSVRQPLVARARADVGGMR